MGKGRSWDLQLQGPGCLGSCACTLVCEARSWALWWAGPCPGVAVGSEGHKAACVLVGGAMSLHSQSLGLSSQNSNFQCLCPQGELQLLPVSPRDSPRSTGRSDPGSFQIIASVLCPWACEILCAPFKSGVSISHSPLGLPKVSPAGLQSQTFWGLIFLVQVPQAGDHDVGFRCLAPWGEPLQLQLFSRLWVTHWGMGLDYIVTPPLLPILLWFLLYIFGCRRSFLVGSSLFHW